MADNVDRVRVAYEAFNRDGLEEVLDTYFDPEVEFHDVTGMPGEKVYKGRDGVREAYRQWMEAWNDFRFVPEQIADAGNERVLIATRIGGHGRESGMELDVLIYELYTVRDGMMAKREAWLEQSLALEAAGLREWPAAT